MVCPRDAYRFACRDTSFALSSATQRNCPFRLPSCVLIVRSSILLLLGLIQNESPRAAVPAASLVDVQHRIPVSDWHDGFWLCVDLGRMEGPVHRLTSRACGVAFGYLVPAIISSHALYFHWANPAAVALQGQLKKLLSSLVDLPNLRLSK